MGRIIAGFITCHYKTYPLSVFCLFLVVSFQRQLMSLCCVVTTHKLDSSLRKVEAAKPESRSHIRYSEQPNV